MAEEKLNKFVINYLTEEQYAAALEAGTLNDNDFYCTSNDLENDEQGSTGAGGGVLIYETDDENKNVEKILACFEDAGVDEDTGYKLMRLTNPIVLIDESGVTWYSLGGNYDEESNIYRVSMMTHNYEYDNLCAITIEPDDEYDKMWLDIIGDGRPKLTLADNLTSTNGTNEALSANQGRILAEQIAALEARIGDINSILATLTEV